MPKQTFPVTCQFCKQTGHNTKCWRGRLADEFMDEYKREENKRNAVAGRVVSDVLTQNANELPIMTQEEENIPKSFV